MQWVKATLALALMLVCALVQPLALATVQNDDLTHFDQHPERGWYFYEQPPRVHKPVALPGNRSQPIQKHAARKKCATPATWTAACGFVDPTTLGLSPDAVWRFEQQEYHQLLHRYSLYPNNANEVYHFQKFQYWALSHAMTASYTWQYNREQHPDINASIGAPVSQFGLAVVKQIEQKSETDFWHTLSKTAFYVLITRSDNPECQAQGQLMRLLQREEKVPVWNLSVDNDHLKGFTRVMHFYQLSQRSQKALATHLKLAWLPTVYLYLKPADNAQKVGRWIRVATGITTLDAIKSRTLNFVEAYRHAIVQGVGEKAHQVPNFRAVHLYPLTHTATSTVKPLPGER